MYTTAGSAKAVHKKLQGPIPEVGGWNMCSSHRVNEEIVALQGLIRGVGGCNGYVAYASTDPARGIRLQG